jgi:hypothetical protein
VLEQHLVRGDGLHVAAARLSAHAVDSASGAVLPRRIEIDIPPAGISIQVDMGDLRVNQPAGDPSQLWSKPVYDGYPEIDLARAVPWTTSPLEPLRAAAANDQPAPTRRWSNWWRRPPY